MLRRTVSISTSRDVLKMYSSRNFCDDNCKISTHLGFIAISLLGILVEKNFYNARFSF